MRAVDRLQTSNAELNRVQDRLVTALNQVLEHPVISGQLLTSISVGTGATQVPHKLGRKPIGWSLVRLRANAVVWDEQDAETRQDLFLRLRASTPVVVDLLVL